MKPRTGWILARLPLFTLAVLAAACRAAFPADGLAESEPIHLVVLHTNDVHGQALPLDTAQGPRGGLLALAEAIERQRARARAEGASVLLVDGGDWWQGTPEGRLDGGLPFVRLLVGLGYDAMCPGNHELDRGVDELGWLLARARPPTVLANVRDPARGGRVDWGPPWRVVARGGLRIALVGLLSTSTPRLTHPDASALVFEDPVEALERVLRELRAEDVDLVIPLTHLGVEEDARLARAFPELPLIVGGHSHAFLEEGRREGQTLLVQAGHGAQALGRVDLWIDRASGAVSASRATLLPLPVAAAPAAVGGRQAALASDLAELSRAAGSAYERVVGRLEGPLERTREPRTSSAGNLVTDLLRASAGADVAVHNKGGLRRDLAAGPVTARQAFELLPFDNTLVVLELDGTELEALFRHALDGRRYLGFEVAGAVLEAELERGAFRLTGVLVDGAPLEPGRRYRLVTNSFLAAGGDGLLPPELLRRAEDTGVLLRDVLVEAFRSRGSLRPTTENRLRVAGGG